MTKTIKEFGLKGILGTIKKPKLEDYVTTDTRYLIEKKIDSCNFIEGYALADQYVEKILESSFFEISLKNKKLGNHLKRNNYEAALIIAEIWLPIESIYSKKYMFFKGQRKKFIHDLLNKEVDELKKYPHQRSSKNTILNHLKLFEDLHLLLTNKYYLRELSITATLVRYSTDKSLVKQKEMELKQVYSKKLFTCFPIAFRRMEKELVSKFGKYSIKDKKVTEYVLEQILEYVKGRRKKI